MSGNLHCTGDPDRAPLRCSLPVSYYHGSIEAAAGVAFALLARERTGAGPARRRRAPGGDGDAEHGDRRRCPTMTGNRGQRAGAFFRQAKSVQREIWPCKDGWVSFALRGGPARIPGLVAMVAYMDEHGMASEKLRAMDWKAYNHNLLSQDEVDDLSARVRRLLPHQDHDRALPGGMRAQPDAGARQHGARDRRFRAARGARLLRRRRASRTRHAAPAGRLRAHDVGRSGRARPSPCAGRRRGSASTPPRCWPSSASTSAELERLRAEGVV